MNKKRIIFFGLFCLLSMTSNIPLTNKSIKISIVMAQEKCNTALKNAEQAYPKNPDEIIKLLLPCLPDSLQAKADKLKAYELLSIAYTLKYKEIEAKKTIEELIKLDNEFKPRTDAPRKFRELIMEEKQHRIKRKRVKNAFIIGGSVLVASVVTGIIMSGEEKAKPLPKPPAYPDQ